MSRIHVPWPIRSDAYTVSGDAFAGAKAKERSVYHLTNRVGPSDCGDENVELLAEGDNRMVMYGLNDFVYQHLQQKVTHTDVDEAAKFLSTAHSFGGSLPFPEHLWRRIVDEYDGYLPLTIYGLPEASTFLPGEPYVQVISEPGFGEIAAMIEPIMVGMVSCASARATVCRQWLQYLREVFAITKFDSMWSKLTTEEKNQIDGVARFFIHDFGMRASSCAEESELLGRAHLLVFHGTDTFNAAYQAIQMGAKRPTGTSILALAHRIVQGHITEVEAFNAIHQAAGKGGIASYVADCYNFTNALKYLVELARMTKDTIVVRPDSGPYLGNVIDIITGAIKAGLVTNDKHGWSVGQNLRYINGDSMNPDKVDNIFSEMINRKLEPSSWGIFGVGGFLRNVANRDEFSSAYKLSAKGNDFEPVCKLSEIPAKRSVPGLVSLQRSVKNPSVFLAKSLEEVQGSDYVLYYGPHGSFAPMESFDALQNRAINEFDALKTEKKGNQDTWSQQILDIQEACVKEHR